MLIRGLIFDFDGLILETEGPIFQAWQELYQDHGCQLTLDTWASIIGAAEDVFDPFSLLEEQLGQPVDRQVLAPQRRLRETELIAVQPVLPGVQDYLQEAKRLGLKVGLASSSSCAWVTGHLSRLGLVDYFNCIRGSDDVVHAKPYPELYLSALAGLGMQADQAIALEDSPNGVLAAKRAGLFCVAVPNDLTRQLSLGHADMQIDSLASLPLEELLLKVNHR